MRTSCSPACRTPTPPLSPSLPQPPRSPSHIIAHCCEFLLESLPQGHAGRSDVDSIQTAIGVMNRVIQDVSTFAALRAETLVTQPALVDLRRMLRHIATTHRYLHDTEMGITVSPEVPQYLVADVARVTQLLGNVMAYAAKATIASGVRIAVELLPLQMTDAAGKRPGRSAQRTGTGAALPAVQSATAALSASSPGGTEHPELERLCFVISWEWDATSPRSASGASGSVAGASLARSASGAAGAARQGSGAGDDGSVDVTADVLGAAGRRLDRGMTSRLRSGDSMGDLFFPTTAAQSAQLTDQDGPHSGGSGAGMAGTGEVRVPRGGGREASSVGGASSRAGTPDNAWFRAASVAPPEGGTPVIATPTPTSPAAVDADDVTDAALGGLAERTPSPNGSDDGMSPVAGTASDVASAPAARAAHTVLAMPPVPAPSVITAPTPLSIRARLDGRPRIVPHLRGSSGGASARSDASASGSVGGASAQRPALLPLHSRGTGRHSTRSGGGGASLAIFLGAGTRTSGGGVDDAASTTSFANRVRDTDLNLPVASMLAERLGGALYQLGDEGGREQIVELQLPLVAPEATGTVLRLMEAHPNALEDVLLGGEAAPASTSDGATVATIVHSPVSGVTDGQPPARNGVRDLLSRCGCRCFRPRGHAASAAVQPASPSTASAKPRRARSDGLVRVENLTAATLPGLLRPPPASRHGPAPTTTGGSYAVSSLAARGLLSLDSIGGGGSSTPGATPIDRSAGGVIGMHVTSSLPPGDGVAGADRTDAAPRAGRAGSSTESIAIPEPPHATAGGGAAGTLLVGGSSSFTTPSNSESFEILPGHHAPSHRGHVGAAAMPPLPPVVRAGAVRHGGTGVYLPPSRRGSGSGSASSGSGSSGGGNPMPPSAGPVDVTLHETTHTTPVKLVADASNPGSDSPQSNASSVGALLPVQTAYGRIGVPPPAFHAASTLHAPLPPELDLSGGAGGGGERDSLRGPGRLGYGADGGVAHGSVARTTALLAGVQPPMPARSGGRRLHVLFADDEASNRAMLARFLQRLGHTYLAVSG